MTGPDSRWHKALSQSDKGFARDVMISANRKSAHDISLYGVATLKKVAEKNILVSCRMVKIHGFARETNEVRLKQEDEDDCIGMCIASEAEKQCDGSHLEGNIPWQQQQRQDTRIH